ncbi:MAG: phytanoyl-CoA dioxygenase family protein [Pirellulales bacterium]
MLNEGQYRDQITHDGYAIVENVISTDAIERLRAAISALPEGDEVRRRTNVYGVRNLLDVSTDVRKLAASPELRALVEPLLGPESFAVRATFFDKVPDANWKLRYHQDRVIAVKKRVDTSGYTAWAIKAGVQQVRPPEGVLLRMLALRVHLDDCNANNGPLRLLAGSHHQCWSRDEIPECKTHYREVTCEVATGGVLAMRPLVLHASTSSEVPEHRRVIHIEYANADLPGELEWQHRIVAQRVP